MQHRPLHVWFTGIVALTLIAAVAAQGPCSSDNECPSNFFVQQFCDNGRCMPTSCTGPSVGGCQKFDRRMYCPAFSGNVKCAPRLKAGQVCRWNPDSGDEQPCAPGLVCTGWHTLTCVRGGKGPTTMDGLPRHEAQALASAQEQPDDSIPPRPGGARPATRATASSTETEKAATNTQSSSSPTSTTGGSSNGGDFSFTTTRNTTSSSSESSGLFSSTPVLVTVCVVAGVMIAVVAGRVGRKRYVPRPPTAPPATAGPTFTQPPPKPMAAPAPTQGSARPYGSPIEEQVEYVPVGQTKAFVEIPLEEYVAQPATPAEYPAASMPGSMPMPMPTPASACPYPPQSPPPASSGTTTPMPMPQSPQPMSPHTPPYPTMATPTPQPLGGSQDTSQQWRPTRFYASPTTVFDARTDPANMLSGPTGPRVEVPAGPGDAELVLPSGEQATSAVGIQVQGNADDDELVLPGPTRTQGAPTTARS